jgi:hypothetical protein
MPKCPYCKESITLESVRRHQDDDASTKIEEVDREVVGTVKKEIMYSCPGCDSVLGFGFFLGGLLTRRP